MATQFAPVKVATIKQGEFAQNCEDTFRQLQEEFIKYVSEHDVTSTASLVMKISLRFDKEKEAYAIVSEIEKKLPKKPPVVTSAFVSDDTEGQPCLWAQAAGTTKGDPHQGRLCTDDGKTIDTQTGEVKEKSKH